MNDIVIRQDIDQRIGEIKAILPPSVSIEAFSRAASIAMSQTKDLKLAESESVFNSLARCASDGLVPDGREAALVVFKKNIGTKQSPNWVQAAQYMPMVDGVLKRARMSGQVSTIAAKVVHENDQFSYYIDEHGEHFQHTPAFGNRGSLKLVYAFARVNGELMFEAMDKQDIDRVRAASKGGNYGPWADWYDRMALKSVLHRLARRLPNASEMVQMLEMGNQMNFQNNQQPQNKNHRNEKDITPENPHAQILEILTDRGSDKGKFLSWCSNDLNKPLADISDMDDEDASYILGKMEAKQ